VRRDWGEWHAVDAVWHSRNIFRNTIKRPNQTVIQSLMDYYRVAAEIFGDVSLAPNPSAEETGFFQFGANNICYGRSRSGVALEVSGSGQYDTLDKLCRDGTTIQMPFDFTEVIENLRQERYRQHMIPKMESFALSEPVRKLYYLVREFLPVSIRRHLQRAYFRDWEKLPFPAWPVDFTVDTLHEDFLRTLMETSGVKAVPFIWFWPKGAPNCLIMTHDVETRAGRDFTPTLMNVDDSYGIKASFQVIPEARYDVQLEYVQDIQRRGFEVNVHDLNHDGRLYQDRKTFLQRAARINKYIKTFDARGFRAGVMYRNLAWYDSYDFSYDLSVPNVAHLEPQRGGCCTVFPYFVGKILEIPLTTIQDYSLFQILNDYSIDLWKKQVDMIRKRNGLMSFIAHPDYLIKPRARKIYESLLAYLREMIEREKIWMALPGEVDRWWRARSQMKLVQEGGRWRIAGAEAERGCIAFAVIQGNRLVYEIADTVDCAGVAPRFS
jgi:hypothetical protein